MAEDLLSQLANPNRFAMLKERGAINTAELEAQAKQQVRVQEIRHSTFNNSIINKEVQQTTLESIPVKEEIKIVEEVKAEEKLVEIKEEPKIEIQPVEVPKVVQEIKPIQLNPIQPIKETTNSRMMHHESAAQIENIFKRLINRG